MNLFRSFHAKILLGYCLVGGLFVALLTSALIQFKVLQVQIAEQRQVTVFYDAIRYARRMEKNYLLYRKPADLKEAIEKANQARQAFLLLPETVRNQISTPQEGVDVIRYAELLQELEGRDRRTRIPHEVQEDLFTVGSQLLKSGESLEKRASDRLMQVVQEHQRDLVITMIVAAVLVLLAGIVVTRRVVRPLRDIESRLGRVAKGETWRVEAKGEREDSEVRSLTASINGALNELENRQQIIARSSRLLALGTMLSGVAHELNNPLSNISSSCQILIEELDEMDRDAMLSLLGQIDDQTLRAQRIVSALLDFSRERSAQRRREPLLPLVEEALLLVRGQLPAQAQVELRIPPEVTIDVDRQRFQQVLVNLIKNAGEALPGEGRVQITAWRKLFAEGNATSLEVEDDGPGILPADLPRIFDPFFTTKEVGKGTGLGLFVAHEIVTQHGGTLIATSAVGRKTRFVIQIPDVDELSQVASKAQENHASSDC